jgi:LuxR family transcriptional regulator, maltose regulon positive regulatory protein
MTRRSPVGAEFAFPPSSDGRRGMALMPSKLVATEPAYGTVERSRLTGLLTSEVQRCPLTLLSGPAGSGKTTLAASWRNGQIASRPVAWLTLDHLDDDPATFWPYVIAALSGVGVHFSDVPALTPSEPPPPTLVPGLASDLSRSPRPVVLVIDNADHISDRSIAAGLDMLVTHAGRVLRLVLCLRADPPLPLHRYRLAGTLGEIRTDQLAFTAEETRDLLAEAGVPVPAEVAAPLQAETQGWAVGLRLATGPLKRGVPVERLVTSLAHDDGSVAQYLFAEVLENQTAPVRHDLLRCSVTAELWPDLLDRLCGHRGVRHVLAGLARTNSFVEQSPGAPGGFLIHPLFREMLMAQLEIERPGEFARLHSVCAEWYVEAGRPQIAVGHAVAAEDWALVSRILVDHLLVCHLLAHGTDAVLGGVRALPPDAPGAESAVIRAVAAVAAGGDVAAADLVLARTVEDDTRRPQLRLSATIAELAAGDVDPAVSVDRVDAAAALAARLPDQGGAARLECAAVLSDLRASALLRSDASDAQLLTALRAAATAAHLSASGRLRRRAVANSALLEALEGNLTRAAQLAEEAEALTSLGQEELADELREPASATALAWVHLRRYALVEAREWLGRAMARQKARDTAGDTARRQAGLDVSPVTAVLQAQQFRIRHEYDLAEVALRRHLDGPRPPRWAADHVVAEAVLLAVARGRAEAGVALLRDGGGDEPWGRRLLAVVDLVTGSGHGDRDVRDETIDSPAGAVEGAVLRACRLFEDGRVQSAADELAAALELARPELLRWPFIDVPPQGRRLLRTHPRLQAAGAWVNPSSGAQPRSRRGTEAAPERGPDIVQELSSREMEVLRYLAEMLSTAEIAATMFISVNTVRTHIRSILRKLSVSRRNQAVRRARDRGLLLM